MKYFLLFIFFNNYASINSQSYFMAGGMRLGSDYGLSFKQRILKNLTGEAILWSSDATNTNVGVTLLVDKHRSIITRNFNMFYGSGLTWRKDFFQNEAIQKYTSIGIPLQAGIEFTIGRINLSWDYTPILYISTKYNAFDSLKGLSVRYVFMNKREGKKMMKSFSSRKSNKT